MIIAKITNEIVEKYPVDIREEFPYTSFPSVITQDSLPEGYFIVEDSEQPHSEWNERCVELNPVSVNGTWTRRYGSETLSEVEQEARFEAKRNELKLAVANRRKEREAAGIEVMNMQVDTDNVSQSKVLGAFVLASKNPDFTVNWKMRNNEFRTLSASEIQVMSTAVLNHVQTCFDEEMNYQTRINAAMTMQDLLIVDAELKQ